MPIILGSPGLTWRKRATTISAYWQCRSDIAAKGYQVKTARLWSGNVGTEPTADELAVIRRECFRLQAEMKEWNRHGDTRRPNKRSRENGMIYFARCGDLIKIGFAKNAAARLIQLQIGSGAPIQLIGTIPGNRHIEKFLHWQFRGSLERGEWFRLTDDLRTFIVQNVPDQTTNGIANDSERMGG